MSLPWEERKAVVGMIHVPALPGTPCHSLSMREIIGQCVREAEIYQASGVDALMIENMHDRPYEKGRAAPEVTAGMTAVAMAVREVFDRPLGLQILAAANQEALAVALASGMEFVRVEGFVFAHVADEGYIDSQAAALLRYRKRIGAEEIRLLTDIKKKHSSHAITGDLDLVECARAAEFFLTDGLIVTGAHTGEEASLEEVRAVKALSAVPVLVGSGATAVNVEEFLRVGDGVIVGSWVKEEGLWTKPVDRGRLERFLAASGR
ncbi:MAG: BtpA/SgcQ family protein [Verrucomicrobiota bacterium]